MLRVIANTQWYIVNKILYTDLKMLMVKEEIKQYSTCYADRLAGHVKLLAYSLIDDCIVNHEVWQFYPLDVLKDR